MERMLFNGWFPLLRTTVVGVPAYAALVVFLRFSGKRTLAKMNAFDLIVTVSLGSTLATIALSEDVAVIQGLLALALLIALQFLTKERRKSESLLCPCPSSLADNPRRVAPRTSGPPSAFAVGPRRTVRFYCCTTVWEGDCVNASG